MLKRPQIYLVFVKEHLLPWVVSIKRTESAGIAKLHSALWTIGTDILSSQEALRTIFDPPSDAESLFYHLGISLHNRVEETASLLPRLFATHSEVLRKQKASLIQANISATPVQYFTLLRLLYDSADDVPAIWKSQAEIIEIVQSMKLVPTADASWNEELRNSVQACCRTLAPPSMGMQCALLNAHEANYTTEGQYKHHCSVFRCITIISGLNYAVVQPHLPKILQACATVSRALFPQTDVLTGIQSHPSSSSSCEDLMRVIIEYHCKTRTLPDYLELIHQVLASLTSSDSSFSFPAFCGIMNGPLLVRSHSSQLLQSLNTFLTPGQTPKVAETVSRILSELLRSVQESHRDSLGKKKQSDPPICVSPPLAIRLAASLRLASYVLPGLPALSLPATTFENLRTTIRSLIADTVLPAAKFSINCFYDRHDDAWVWKAVGAAALHLYSATEARCRWVGALPTLVEQEKQKMVDMLQNRDSGDLHIEVVGSG